MKRYNNRGWKEDVYEVKILDGKKLLRPALGGYAWPFMTECLARDFIKDKVNEGYKVKSIVHKRYYYCPIKVRRLRCVEKSLILEEELPLA